MNVEQQNGNDKKKQGHLPDEQYGYPKIESKKWGFFIRVLDPKIGETTCLFALQDNEATFSICSVTFHDKETYVSGLESK